MRARITAILLAVLGFILCAAGPAAAHAALLNSNPANGANVHNSPPDVSLTFSERLLPSSVTITVTDSDRQFWQIGTPVVDGQTASIRLGELGAAGNYAINYRVVSEDGHTVTGQINFLLRKAGNGTPSDAPVTTPSASLSGWLFIVPIGAIALVVTLWLVYRSRRKANSDAVV